MGITVASLGRFQVNLTQRGGVMDNCLEILNNNPLVIFPGRCYQCFSFSKLFNLNASEIGIQVDFG